MKTRLVAIVALATCFAFGLCHAQTPGVKATPDLKQVIPLDAKITYGKLDNGITYYIRVNKKPEKRAELRLAVNAGAVLENDNQKGLAHFSEHMAFNGTKNFKKQELVNYVESIGMRFGPELNGYTSFDETVYILQVPTDSAAIVEKGFDILEDWAHLVSFDDEEIDKERGVIIEEWRLGRGADARIRDKQFPMIFKDSRYADHLPIGDKHTLETFEHETLRQFYGDWYRPDLMAVIAVGDFDKDAIERLIKKHFSGIPSLAKERPRTSYSVPDHKETLYAFATDPEATISNVAIYFKHDVPPYTTVGDYRRRIVENLYNAMFGTRLYELTQQSDPPFIYANSFNGQWIRTKEFYYLGAVVKENGISRGLDAVLTEGMRVRRFGFTQSELDRMKQNMLRGMQQAYEERDKTESANYAAEYIRHFLQGEPSPGIEYEYDLYKSSLPGITLAEVNSLAAEWITDGNRVVAVSAPEKAGLTIPPKEELAAVIDGVGKKTITAYIDKTTEEPLVPGVPKAGTIVARSENKDLGTFEWRLSNGVRVVLKPTDFKNDEVLFTAFSPGGTSLATDQDFISASMSSGIVAEGGAGAFDRIALQKKLAGKIANVMPMIRDLEEGFMGNASPQDLTTMFQLIYLYATAPRMDSTAFLSLRTRYRAFLENRSARPESAFEDTLQVTMAQYHFRARPFTLAMLDEIDLKKAFDFYRQRFGDASDFTFIFVGSFTPKEIEPLVLTYLGGLPSLERKETWKDVGYKLPKGIIEKSVKKGIEPKSQVRISFSGPFDWKRHELYAINSLASVLRMKLREQIREEKGGTYGVGVGASPHQYPTPEYTFSISFGCAPDRVEELTTTVYEQIDSLQRFGPASSYIQKVKETQRRERETEMKQNRSWLNWLQHALSNGIDPMQILDYTKLIETLSEETIKKAAERYLDTKNHVRVVLYPQEE
jgi:zinc protease